MALQQVGVGAAPNDGNGEPLRNGVIIMNENFGETESRLAVLELKNYSGFLDYNDLATASSPISILAGNTAKLTNDGLGPFTNKAHPPTGVTDVWLTAGQTFDFSELSLGAIVHYRLDITVDISGANAEVTGEIELAAGGTPYTLNIFRNYFKSAGVYNITVANFIYMGDNNTLNGGGEFRVSSSNNTDVRVNGWAMAIHTRAPLP